MALSPTAGKLAMLVGQIDPCGSRGRPVDLVWFDASVAATHQGEVHGLRSELQGEVRPHRDLLAVSLIARLPLGMAGVGLVSIALKRGLGPGTGGTALAAYAVGVAIAGPVWGRRCRVSGVRAVLTACALGQLVACAWLALAGWGSAAFLAGATALGASTPPVMAIMRATWDRLFAGSPSAANRLAVIETMNTEVVHIVGRTVVAGLAAIAAWTVPFTYLAFTLGGAWMLRRDARVAAPPAVASHRSLRPVATAVMACWAAALGMAAISHGLAATAMVTSVPSDEIWRGPAMMAIWGLGSLAGGAVWLAGRSASSPRVVALGGFIAFSGVACLIGLPGTTRLVPVWGLVFLLGVPIAPTVSAVFQAARIGVPPDRHVEAFAMLNSVNLGGFAIGSIVGGWAVQAAGGAVPAFLLAGAASLGAALAVAVTWTRPVARRTSSVASSL